MDAGLYAFVAESTEATPAEVFEARWEVTDAGTVAAVVAALSDAGMVVTAGTGGPSGYTLVGTRRTGNSRPLDALTLLQPGVDPAASVAALVAGGYAPVAVLLHPQLPDGGFEVVSIGQR